MDLPRTEALELQQDGLALHIWLNRPDVRNALSLQMVQELGAVFDAIAPNPEIRAVVLRGKGGNFCAGGDIKDMAGARAEAARSGNDEAYVSLNRGGGTLITKIDRAPQVVIVALEGAVLGGGFGLACVSDVAISLDTTQFGLPETSLGIPPAQISPFVVQRIGLTQARRLALLGVRFNGEEALRLGIVHQVVDSVQALEAAVAEALALVKRAAPQASRATKALLHRAGKEPLEGLLDDAARQFARAVSAGEGVEGTQAFVQKRAPKWAE
ncbi:enoyl-CoA hydratase/isomerase family protein [Solimonas sp. K1W22B-7]|uniref:enoyl-CoA hydratase/isomerase family protein n=1 Tax=Solimonas sp. K1W22B-7 TaxID=2303331 RepID=UPI000E32E0D7|nr:enoyl-CoA hydratase-related protein [Solimonas sp. K1W22B-7]AXQ31099.1 enoyl-CoA hydratase/isomerase family protein [Solimonas sp. K1W22B-7]